MEREALISTKDLSTKDTKIHEEGMAELLLKEEVYAIVGAAIEVHRELGPDFLEAVYQETIELELREQNVPFEAQKPLRISYKGKMLNKEYIADLVCYGQIIVELKALSRLSGNEEAQVLNYLKATGFKVGLLINFGSHGKLDWKRLVK
jgi:GxxExxY protein